MADGSSGGQDVGAAAVAAAMADGSSGGQDVAAATEHSILLHRDEARGLALEARAQYARGDLHALARDALDRIAYAGPESASPLPAPTIAPEPAH